MLGTRRSAEGVLLGAAVAVAIVAFPALSFACPVCFDPRDDNQSAFLSMTIFMSLLPLGMAGAIVLWLRRRAEAVAAVEPEREPG